MPYKLAQLLEPGEGKDPYTNQDFVVCRKQKTKITIGAFDGVSKPAGAPPESEAYKESLLTAQGCWGRGRVAAEIVARVLQQIDTVDPSDIIVEANEIIADIHDVLGLNIADPLQRLACAGAIATIDVASGRFQWATVADCRVALIHPNGRYECLNSPTTQDAEHVRLRTKLRCDGLSEADIATHPEWLAMFGASLRLVNQPKNICGYGVINGDEELISNNHMQSGQGVLPQKGYLLVTTDGLDFPLKPSEVEADWWRSAFYGTAREHGPLAGLRAVHETIGKLVYKMDPKGHTRPRTHLGRDDAGAVCVLRQ